MQMQNASLDRQKRRDGQSKVFTEVIVPSTYLPK
jgi:hypothetical protein